MQWNELFTPRSHLFQRSSVREFLKHAHQPGMISFAGGLPDPDLLPVDAVRAAVDRALSAAGARSLQYGETQGLPELRALIAARASCTDITADNVIITSGSQQGLDMIGRLFLDERPVVAVQNPTYLAALSAWRPSAPVFQVLDVQSERHPADARATFAYVIPTFTNPTGDTLDLIGRERLISWAAANSTPLLEDDPYRELRYDGDHLPSLLQVADSVAGPVMQLGTISKTLAPGLRIGWIIAPQTVIDALTRVKQALDLHTSTFNQHIALELINSGAIETRLPAARACYREKRDLMLNALSTLTGEFAWTPPEGGMFLMLTAKIPLPGTEIARRALNQGVCIVPGREFHIEGGENTIRLNFSHPTTAQIPEGVQRLKSALV